MLKKSFSKYLNEHNKENSGRASSYIRALDLISEMIQVKPFNYGNCADIWNTTSVDLLESLYQFTIIQKQKGDLSDWNFNDIPKSYLQGGFCSAALRAYQEFLVRHNYEQILVSKFENFQGEENDLPHELTQQLEYPHFLIDEQAPKKGKDIVRMVKTRSNQSVFRKIILQIYNNSCCITGLDIPQINRASHIIPWADDDSIRLDPRNGLCLSATYDAAFDRHLISLDEDYRLIVSKDIKGHYSNQSAKDYFIDREGERITLPTQYQPSQQFLALHRKACDL